MNKYPEQSFDEDEQEYIKEIGQALEKVMTALRASPELITMYIGKELTQLTFLRAAADHAFDNNPEKFGITKNEGHAIRAWAQNTVTQRFSKETGWTIEDKTGLINKIKL